MSGIPKLNKHGRRRQKERREPLPGTKKLMTPNDGSLSGLLQHGQSKDLGPCRISRILGWSAVVWVVGFLCLVGYMLQTDEFIPGFVMVSLGGIHVLSIFSQILSDGQNKPGAYALVGLYVGLILLAVIGHLVR